MQKRSQADHDRENPNKESRFISDNVYVVN